MTPYERGFMDKCAEYGVDPERLVKSAGGAKDLIRAIGLGRLLRAANGVAHAQTYLNPEKVRGAPRQED